MMRRDWLLLVVAAGLLALSYGLSIARSDAADAEFFREFTDLQELHAIGLVRKGDTSQVVDTTAIGRIFDYDAPPTLAREVSEYLLHRVAHRGSDSAAVAAHVAASSGAMPDPAAIGPASRNAPVAELLSSEEVLGTRRRRRIEGGKSAAVLVTAPNEMIADTSKPRLITVTVDVHPVANKLSTFAPRAVDTASRRTVRDSLLISSLYAVHLQADPAFLRLDTLDRPVKEIVNAGRATWYFVARARDARDSLTVLATVEPINAKSKQYESPFVVEAYLRIRPYRWRQVQVAAARLFGPLSNGLFLGSGGLFSWPVYRWARRKYRTWKLRRQQKPTSEPPATT